MDSDVINFKFLLGQSVKAPLLDTITTGVVQRKTYTAVPSTSLITYEIYHKSIKQCTNITEKDLEKYNG